MSSVSDDQVMKSLLLSMQRGVRGRQEHLGGEKQAGYSFSWWGSDETPVLPSLSGS